MKKKFKIGDRVCRQVFLDDGTWIRYGDKCLDKSPLKFGTIVNIITEASKYGGYNDMVVVLWDSGKKENYFDHGVDLVK